MDEVRGVLGLALIAATFYVVLVALHEAWFRRLMSFEALRHPLRRRRRERKTHIRVPSAEGSLGWPNDVRQESRAIFDRMLRGEASSAEYVAAVKRETRELLEQQGWAPQAPPRPDPQTVEAFRALEAERDRLRGALEVCHDALKGDHLLAGAHCGDDACALCWAQAEVATALDRNSASDIDDDAPAASHGTRKRDG